MSYTRTFTSSVSVSGSVRVSYPASEHGGTTTAHYHQTVPITINLHVDTDAFDTSINGTNVQIDLLTGAVVAMNAAQVKAISDASKQVSQHIVDGFFHHINSSLTMQMAGNKSVIQGKFALLYNFAKDMVQMHDLLNQ